MRRLGLILVCVLLPVAGAAQTKVKVGTVRSTVVGGVVSAQVRGYFKEARLDVDIALIDASAGFVPALATNELHVVEGGISANLFNGIAQGLPIKIAFDSASTPINHSLMLRFDLRNEVKSIRDLKGRMIAVNAPNSIALYEVTRILESAGLSLNDVQTKVIPFAQMAVAFQTKAIDAGLAITPFNALLAKQEIAIAWIDADATVRPSPVMISASMFNADWAKRDPATAEAFFTALLRGVRDYCNAYHGGTWRPELLRLLVANGVSTSAELLDAIPWPARNPDGYVRRESLADVQRWYATQGLVRTELPLDQIADESFAREANRKLGAFRPEPADSTRAGCGK
jgi:NitT/TauT family transport system substrate-binding protein